MTIVTKPVSEKKLDKQEQPLVQNEINEGIPKPVKKDVEIELPPATYLALRSRAHRISTATTVCVFVTALLVLTIGIIGGVYLYHQFARTKMQRFRGWCSVPYDNDLDAFSSRLRGRPVLTDDSHERDHEVSMENGNQLFFKEEFEIDIEHDTFEQIDVPDFTGGRRGRFIHDFSANKTGIIDLDGRRCFVMPLNRSRVLPPNSLLDLVVKMRAGYYEVDTEVVRETMRVVKPPITDYGSLGFYIARECSKLPTYKLERMTKPVFKRSVEKLSDSLVFTEFAGKKISQYEVMIEE
uniref:Integral membrane protein 2 n=1 Tax=Hemiscolopendra marginata TaxID=943146 RepID=A0A646QDI3_9MYRI